MTGGAGEGGSNRGGITHVVLLNEELDSKFHDVLAACGRGKCESGSQNRCNR